MRKNCWSLVIVVVVLFYSCKEKASSIEKEVVTNEMEIPSTDTVSLGLGEKENLNEVQEISSDEEKSIPTHPDVVLKAETKVTDVKKTNGSSTKNLPVSTTSDVKIQPQPTKKEDKPALPEPVSINEKNVIIALKPNHAIWDNLLKKHVSPLGVVNYKGISQDVKLLNEYLLSLSGPFDIKNWSPYEKLAFWINVYNAFTIKLIVDNYPLKSIRDLYQGQPWSQSIVYANNTYYSLDEVQKKIIMRQFGDPRIHFAINCAAKSCPPLANKAYTKDNVNTLLETQTRSFINSNLNTIDSKKSLLSKIFEWYAGDFEDVIDFINKYSSKKIDEKTKITYTDYDWSLNGS